MSVENFDEKKKAFEEGSKRIERCQKILNDDNPLCRSTISLVAGSIDVPVSLIRIDGIIDVSKLNTIYKILMDLDHTGDENVE